jgi:hypothetical protein
MFNLSEFVNDREQRCTVVDFAVKIFQWGSMRVNEKFVLCIFGASTPRSYPLICAQMIDSRYRAKLKPSLANSPLVHATGAFFG